MHILHQLSGQSGCRMLDGRHHRCAQQIVLTSGRDLAGDYLNASQLRAQIESGSCGLRQFSDRCTKSNTHILTAHDLSGHGYSSLSFRCSTSDAFSPAADEGLGSLTTASLRVPGVTSECNPGNHVSFPTRNAKGSGCWPRHGVRSRIGNQPTLSQLCRISFPDLTANKTVQPCSSSRQFLHCLDILLPGAFVGIEIERVILEIDLYEITSNLVSCNAGITAQVSVLFHRLLPFQNSADRELLPA